MTVHVDSSAFVAILNADDKNHGRARAVWDELGDRKVPLVCNNYVLVETVAVSQNRLGLSAVKALHENIVPVLAIEWLDEARHQAAVSALLRAGRRGLSLVDCTSFETMRRRGITTTFTLDRHFAEQGFECVP